VRERSRLDRQQVLCATPARAPLRTFTRPMGRLAGDFALHLKDYARRIVRPTPRSPVEGRPVEALRGRANLSVFLLYEDRERRSAALRAAARSPGQAREESGASTALAHPTRAVAPRASWPRSPW
jgi:hypothetical protein